MSVIWSGNNQARAQNRRPRLGRTFDTTFSISTTGGLEYLFINERPNSFSFLGVTVSGRLKISVSNNSLQYFRWYGSLRVANPFGGWLIDFNSHINLSAYELCPAHFGVPSPPWPLSDACVTLYF